MCANELQEQLEDIISDARLEPAPDRERNIPSLTAWNRTKWAETRETFFSSGVNKSSLYAIESAMWFVVLDDNEPKSWTEQANSLIAGEAARWFDKSFTFVVFKNGRCGINAEHSWADAPVLAHMVCVGCWFALTLTQLL